MKRSLRRAALLSLLLVALSGFLTAARSSQAAPTPSQPTPAPSRAPSLGKEPTRVLQEEGLDFSRVAFSPDGKWLAAGGSNYATFIAQDIHNPKRVSLICAAKVWETATWKRVRTLPLTAVTTGLQFSPDGQWLAVMTAQRKLEGRYQAPTLNGWSTLILYRTRDWSVLRRIVNIQPLCPFAFSPQGDRLMVGNRLLSTATWQKVRALNPVTASGGSVPPPFEIASLSFAPDGRTVATYEAKGLLRLWNPATGKLVWTTQAWGVSKSGEHDGADMPPSTLPRKVAFAPDGTVLLTSSRSDEMVRLWNAADGKLLRSLRAGSVGDPIWGSEVEGVDDTAFFPSGKAFITSSEVGMRVWDVASGRLLQSLGFENSYLNGDTLAFAPDGRTFAASQINSFCNVNLWPVHDTPNSHASNLNLPERHVERG